MPKKPASPAGPTPPPAGSTPPPPLSPHPLVLGLAARLFGNLDVIQAHVVARGAAQQRYGVASGAVTQLVNARDRPEIVRLAGYLAAAVNDPDQIEWQVMFLDETADRYVLVRSRDIVFHDRVDDTTAAFGLRDLLWVRAEARIGSGDQTESIAGRFTAGGFMRAGQFRASMSGGTLGAASELGPLCTALTPCCCGKRSP